MLSETLIALLSLMLISIGALALSKKTGIPYTAFLLLIGTALIPLSSLSFFSFIREFQLSSDMLLLVFLPTLIFESAYTINIREFAENIKSISILAIVSFLISAGFVSGALYVCMWIIGVPIPFIVALLFGTLISATDPVAVLSLFKDFGAPRRLSLIFEGESLFNDGTSFALFIVVLGIVMEGFHGWDSIGEGIAIFIMMIVGGLVFGLFMGFLFSKFLEKMRDNDFVQITLTMVAAHLTFLLSEVISQHVSVFGFPIHISSIIATVCVAVVVGNYGRSKMSHTVEAYMEKFWGYFAFIANSLVFVSMGLLFYSLHVHFTLFIVPVLLSIGVVMLGRALSIYPVLTLLNYFQWERFIPYSWQHLLSWGSLRGALAITMVFLIPDNATIPGWEYPFSIKEFVAALTIGCIYFTLLIKATTIRRVMNRFRLGELSDLEEAQYRQAKPLIYAHAVEKFSDYHNKGYITDQIFDSLKRKYDLEYAQSSSKAHSLYETNEGRDLAKRALRVYAIGIERHFLKVLFRYGEVTEPVYKRVLGKLSIRLSRVEYNEEERFNSALKNTEDWLEKLVNFLRRFILRKAKLGWSPEERYMYYRAQEIIARKVIKYFRGFVLKNGYDFFGDEKIFNKVLDQYLYFEKGAREKMVACAECGGEGLAKMREDFGRRGVLKAEEDEIDELTENEMITPKLSILLRNELKSEASGT